MKIEKPNSCKKLEIYYAKSNDSKQLQLRIIVLRTSILYTIIY